MIERSATLPNRDQAWRLLMSEAVSALASSRDDGRPGGILGVRRRALRIAKSPRYFFGTFSSARVATTSSPAVPGLTRRSTLRMLPSGPM